MAGDGSATRRSRARTGRLATRCGAGIAALLVGLVLAGCRSGPPPTLTDQGDAAFARGDLAAAEALYRRAVEQAPADVRAWHGRARIAASEHDPESALAYFFEVSRHDRAYLTGPARADYTETLVTAGRARLQRDRPDGAVRALRAARTLEPARPGIEEPLSRALTARGQRLAMMGRREGALRDFRDAIELRPTEAAPYVGAAEVLLASGRRDEALELLAAARRHHPTDHRVRALTMEAVGLH